VLGGIDALGVKVPRIRSASCSTQTHKQCTHPASFPANPRPRFILSARLIREPRGIQPAPTWKEAEVSVFRTNKMAAANTLAQSFFMLGQNMPTQLGGLADP
jgi:hypothetical protein